MWSQCSRLDPSQLWADGFAISLSLLGPVTPLTPDSQCTFSWMQLRTPSSLDVAKAVLPFSTHTQTSYCLHLVSQALCVCVCVCVCVSTLAYMSGVFYFLERPLRTGLCVFSFLGITPEVWDRAAETPPPMTSNFEAFFLLKIGCGSLGSLMDNSHCINCS